MPLPGESVVTVTGTAPTFDSTIGGTVMVGAAGTEVSFQMFGPAVGLLVFPRLSEAVADTLMLPSASVPAPATGTVTVAAPPACVPDTDLPLLSVSVTVMVSEAVESGARSMGTPTVPPFWTSSKLMNGCGVTSWGAAGPVATAVTVASELAGPGRGAFVLVTAWATTR